MIRSDFGVKLPGNWLHNSLHRWPKSVWKFVRTMNANLNGHFNEHEDQIRPEIVSEFYWAFTGNNYLRPFATNLSGRLLWIWTTHIGCRFDRTFARNSVGQWLTGCDFACRLGVNATGHWPWIFRVVAGIFFGHWHVNLVILKNRSFLRIDRYTQKGSSAVNLFLPFSFVLLILPS